MELHGHIFPKDTSLPCVVPKLVGQLSTQIFSFIYIQYLISNLDGSFPAQQLFKLLLHCVYSRMTCYEAAEIRNPP